MELLVAYLSAFRCVRKTLKTDYYLRHVRLSVRVEQLDTHWTDFDEILHLGSLRKSVEIIQVSLKSDTNVGHFT
jgi:hypothetical protein